MAGNLVKKVMLKIVADDGDSEAKLDKITAKAEELKRLHPDLKVRVDSAAASAKLAVLRKELKDTSAAAGDGPGLRGRLLALGSTAGEMAGLGAAFGAFSKDASMASRVMSGFSLATGLLEGPISGLIVGVGGLASGITAAGAGLGAFGLVAKSVWSQASTAASAYAAAQKRVQLATTSAQRTSALQAEKAALYGLSPPVKALTVELGNVHNMWQKFVSAAAPGVVGVLSQGIGILSQHFGILAGFLPGVESALSKLMAQLSHGLNSQGFASFIHTLQANAGPAILKLGDAIGHIAVGLGGVLKAFMPFSQIMLSGLDRITAKFAHWGETLTQHSGFQSLVSMAKQDMPYVIGIVKNLGGAIVHLGGSMTGLSTFANSKALLQIALPFSQLVNWLSKANPGLLRAGLYMLAAGGAAKKLSPAVSGISSGIKIVQGLSAGFRDAGKAAELAADGTKEFTLGTKIAAAATRVWTGVQAAFDVVMDANPIALVVIGIAALIAIIVVCVIKFKAFREFWVKLWKDVVHLAGVAFDWVKSHFKLLATVLLAITTGGLGLVVVAVASHFHQIESGAVRLVSSVTGFFRSLPGRILGALGDLGSLLLHAGENLIMGLVHGIESVAMAPVHAVEGIVGDIRSLLPFSPAKRGPLSGQGSPDIAGRKIGLMLAGGIRQSSPVVAAAATAMAGAAVTHAGAGGRAAGGQEIVLRIEGSDQSLINALVLALRRDIRVKGGNVQTVLGH